MLRRLAGTAILLVVTGTAAFAADDPYPSRISYALFRDGQQIGHHTVTFERNGPVKVVSVLCEVEVRKLGVAAYRYSHRGREEWDGGRLLSLRTTTDDNGQRHAVTAERRGDALEVERSAPARVPTTALADQGYRGPDVTRQTVPGDLLPTSGWNFRQVQQTSLLNTQDGTIARIRVAPAGRETVRTMGNAVTATRYRYTGDLKMDQWFDDRGRWIKGTFAAFDGSTIEYILQE